MTGLKSFESYDFKLICFYFFQVQINQVKFILFCWDFSRISQTSVWSYFFYFLEFSKAFNMRFSSSSKSLSLTFNEIVALFIALFLCFVI